VAERAAAARARRVDFIVAVGWGGVLVVDGEREGKGLAQADGGLFLIL